MKKWTAVSYDVSKILHTVPTKHVKVPGNIKLELVIQLEDAAFIKLSKDPSWIQKMHDHANTKVDPVMDALKKKVADADKKASGFDPKTAELFSRDLNEFIKLKMNAAGAEMAKEIDKFFEDYKKGKTELLKFRVVSGGKIAFQALNIAGSVGMAAVSHGALSPVAILGIVKSAVAIGQECTKLALSCDQMGKLVQGELKILQKFMIEDLAKAKALGKIGQGVKEVGLNVLSGALGVDTPALKNCKDHLAVHKVDISKVEQKSHNLSKAIYSAMDAEALWRKKFEAAKKDLPADKVGKIVVEKEKVEKALHQMIEATIKANQAIEEAKERQSMFEKTLNAMMKGLPDWLGHAQMAASLGLTMGLHMGAVGSVLDDALKIVESSAHGIEQDMVGMAREMQSLAHKV